MCASVRVNARAGVCAFKWNEGKGWLGWIVMVVRDNYEGDGSRGGIILTSESSDITSSM